ncbi:MAG: RluA family pseudouridine synthase [Clostridia bacterium]|nr:RluA family pseudouridine synthase [Clostridia bacterium]
MRDFKCLKNQKLSKLILSEYGANITYSTVMKLIRNKDVKVNSKRVSKDVTVEIGDNVEVYYNGEEKAYAPVFNECGVLVFNKPPTITSEDFEALLKKTFGDIKLCHRLDRNTSGLLVFASDNKAYEELLSAFKHRTIDKFYLAEVYGKLAVKKARLTAYLYKDEKNSQVKIYDNLVKGSQKIITEYEVVEERENTSLLSVKLITGKTHQIRAHLAHVGHFIVGDGKYGDVKINKALNIKRQKLTAYKLKFNFEKDSYLYPLNGVEVIVP